MTITSFLRKPDGTGLLAGCTDSGGRSWRVHLRTIESWPPALLPGGCPIGSLNASDRGWVLHYCSPGFYASPQRKSADRVPLRRVVCALAPFRSCSCGLHSRGGVDSVLWIASTGIRRRCCRTVRNSTSSIYHIVPSVNHLMACLRFGLTPSTIPRFASRRIPSAESSQRRDLAASPDTRSQGCCFKRRAPAGGGCPADQEPPGAPSPQHEST
jgi:hypothetical protein